MTRSFLVAVGATALLLASSACVSPTRSTSVSADIEIQAHAWVYYPLHDVYRCAHHGHYWVYTHGSWAERQRITVDLADGFQVSARGAKPFRAHASHRRSWKSSSAQVPGGPRAQPHKPHSAPQPNTAQMGPKPKGGRGKR